MIGKNTKALFMISAFTMALFLFSFADSAEAQFSITGKVVSIDKGAGTLSVDPYYPFKGTEFKGGPMTFGLLRTDPYNRATTLEPWVMSGNEAKKIDDIRVGDWVTVTYHQESTGAIVADGIALTAPPMLPERRAGIAPAAPVYDSKAVTGTPGYYDARQAGLLSYSGRIIAIDHSSKSLALDPMTARGEHKIFALRPGASVFIGSDNRSFNDLKLGDWVTVNYHQESFQNVVADSVAVITPAGMPSGYREGTSLYPRDRTMRSDALASNHFSGKVVALDKDSRTVIVAPADISASSNFGPKGEQVFVLKEGSLINMDSKNLTFEDIRLGDNVTITYHDEGGSIIADNIAITAPSLVPFEERG